MVVRRTLLGVITVLFLAGPVSANTAETHFQTARTLYLAAVQQEGPEQIANFRRVKKLLDVILTDHPESSLALGIILNDNIDGLDVAALNAALEAADAGVDVMTEDVREAAVAPAPELPELAPRAEPQQAESTVDLVTSEQTQVALGLDRQDVRDLQSRLLVLGHDPNGVDGVVGRGTRAAVAAWQSRSGLPATGFLNAGQLALLKRDSEDPLAGWLSDPDNARLYEPPPPIALGPSNMSGSWRYVSNCGPNSRLGRVRINGIFAMRHVGGNRYTGTLRNSQGLVGRVQAQLNDRNVRGTVNFGLLLGRTQLNARVDDQQLVIRGRDSNRCSFYASK